MVGFTTNRISKAYKNEYATWRDDKLLQDAKRQEYVRQNSDAISGYDRQRAINLLNAVDIMDKSVSVNSDHLNTVVESATSMGLGYAAILGATLGVFVQKSSTFVQKVIDKVANKYPKSKNVIPMGITVVSGVLGMIAAYPAYTFFSNLDTKIDRKKRFDTMEKELQDPKVFAVLDENQKKIFQENLDNLEITNNLQAQKTGVKKGVKTLKDAFYEILHYDKEQSVFRKKYEEDGSDYEKKLSEKGINDAKKDRVMLCVLMRTLNTNAQSYEEKMQKFMDNFITFSFALGSLITLGCERLARRLNFKKSSVPAGMGVVMMVLTTIYATWIQKRAAHVGRFVAKQQLMENPERLIYISKKQTNTIEDDTVHIEQKKEPTTWQFLTDFYKHNKEYDKWKKTPSLSGKDISLAMADLELSPKQIQDGQRLRTNMFKTFYKIDSNTQNYSSKIDLVRESIKYPLVLVLGTLGSMSGVKHLLKIRNSNSSNVVFKESLKYIGTISLFTFPTLLVNSYFAKMKKMGARISDMLTMKDLEDYRFFADYSEREKELPNCEFVNSSEQFNKFKGMLAK